MFGFEYNNAGGGFDASYGGGNFGGFNPMGSDDTMGGGGFVESTGKSAQKKSRDNEALLPVTIKQLLTAEFDGETYKLNDVPVVTVKLIGFIESLQPHSTNHVYIVNDGSGLIECKKWIDKHAQDPSDELPLGENSVVRIFGSMREYEGKRHLQIYYIRPLEDWNELTHHLLEVSYVHLQHTKGPLPGSTGSPEHKAYNPNAGHSTNHSHMNITPGGPAFFGQLQPGGLNLNSRLGGSDQIAFHQEVISAINQLCTYAGNSGGVHVNAIFNEVKRKFPTTTSDEFNRTLMNLVNNGEVYTGAADNLYMAL